MTAITHHALFGARISNCFGGCGAAAIVAAVGLEFDVLFPDKPLGHAPPTRQRVFRADAFDAIDHDVTVVWLIGCDLHKGKQISQKDYQRLGQAVAALCRIREASYGSR